MGQTASEFRHWDSDGILWTAVVNCPYCGAMLCEQSLPESMGMGPDDLIVCDTCGSDVEYGSAEIEWRDDEGTVE